jgi:hypothetical protein
MAGTQAVQDAGLRPTQEGADVGVVPRWKRGGTRRR